MISSALPPIHVVIDNNGPSVTDWIATMTGALAFIAAVLAVIPSWRQLRMLAEDRRKDQAAKVSVWTHYDLDTRQIQLIYANASAAPVYEVKGHVALGGTALYDFDEGIYGPTSAPVVDPSGSHALQAHIFAKLRERFNPDAVDAVDDEGRPSQLPVIRLELYKLLRQVEVELSFRDAAGMRWHRLADGHLASERSKKWWRLKR